MSGEDFAVLRGKHRMFRQSYVGGLYSARRVYTLDRRAASKFMYTYQFGS